MELLVERMSDVKITKMVAYGSVRGLTYCLSSNVETHDGWLLNLEFQVWITEDNIVVYSFLSKPTASKVCLQGDSAFNQNTSVQFLSSKEASYLDNISNKWALHL